MARRKHTGKKTALGSDISAVSNSIVGMAEKVAARHIDFPYTQEQLLSWVFTEEDLMVARAAWSVIYAPRSYASYTVGDISFGVTFTDMVPIAEHRLKIDPQRGKPLLDVIAEVTRVARAFGVVSYVANWLNENATLGAIRYYFPSMLALAPNCKALAEAKGGTFREPQGISRILPLIREASTTVASALMLAEYERQHDSVTITVGGDLFTQDGTDMRTPYFLLGLV